MTRLRKIGSTGFLNFLTTKALTILKDFNGLGIGALQRSRVCRLVYVCICMYACVICIFKTVIAKSHQDMSIEILQ